MTSDHPEVIEPTDILFDGDTPEGGVDLQAHRPAVDTVVTLTLTLGTTSISTSALVSPLPTTVGAVRMTLEDPGPVHGGASWQRIRVSLPQPAPATSVYVDLTSDHPEAFAPRWVQLFAGEYYEYVYWNAGEVDATTNVTITARVREFPTVTATASIVVHPSVASIAASQPVVNGVPFTVTVTMRGPADVDQPVIFSTGPIIACTSRTPTLTAGSTEVTADCVAHVTEDRYGYVTFQLGDRYSVSQQFHVAMSRSS